MSITRRILAAFMALSLAACATRASRIPGDVTELAWGRIESDGRWQDVRLVIFGYCSPEHCFSRGQLEWFAGATPDPDAEVVATTTIEELESISHRTRCSLGAGFQLCKGALRSRGSEHLHRGGGCPPDIPGRRSSLRGDLFPVMAAAQQAAEADGRGLQAPGRPCSTRTVVASRAAAA